MSKVVPIRSELEVPTVTCPLCQAAVIDIVAKVPKLTVYKCRKCFTTFSIESNARTTAFEEH